MTDIYMYMYVEVDWTRIHQYPKRLYLAAQMGGGGGGNQIFSSLRKGTDGLT